jgi:uncharacterized membrane protein YccC
MSWLPPINRQTLLFSINCFAAAMLALYVAFSLGLPRPYWAMTTAYIVAHPLSGAVRSKALYRMGGTMLGGAAAVVMVPALADAPPLLCLAMALWVGACLAVSLLDRTPRSYVVMLAGYTAAIIGFPSVGQPQAIFETAVFRVVEIGLGILSATLVHSLVFPVSVGSVVQSRLSTWLAEADRWAMDVLNGAGAAVTARDRRHLAAAASDIQILAVHLPFDTSRANETTVAVRALHERMLILIPLLSGVSDRLSQMARGSPPEESAGLVRRAAACIAAGAGSDATLQLVGAIEAEASRRAPTDWRGLLEESLLVRLADAVKALNEAHALLAHIRAPDAPVAAHVAAALATAERQPLHRDLPLAVRSGAACAIAILIACALWIGAGWTDGAAAAVMAAVFCCLFAATDDPAPAIARFGVFFLVALPLAALYLLVLLPAIDGFPMLAAVMAPALLLIGLYIPDSKRGLPATAVVMSFCGALTLQESFTPDFAAFLNGNLAQFVGVFVAIAVTRALRSMSAEASARRLLGQTWRGIARLARATSSPEPAAFAARLIDRLGLLTPKLAEVDGGDLIGVDALRDLRIGMNIVEIQRTRLQMPAAATEQLADLLAGVAGHFDALARGRIVRPPASLLACLDRTLAALAGSRAGVSQRGVASLVGLRRGLFPDSPGFLAPAPADAGPLETAR